LLKGFHYTRQPTLEVLVGAVIFVAALITATFVVTARYDSGAAPASDAPGVWSIQNSGTDSNLNAVDFVDSLRGWAVGGNGTILHTSDAGQTWEGQNAGTQLELTSLDFQTATEGWAVGKLGLVIHTTPARPGKHRPVRRLPWVSIWQASPSPTPKQASYSPSEAAAFSGRSMAVRRGFASF